MSSTSAPDSTDSTSNAATTSPISTPPRPYSAILADIDENKKVQYGVVYINPPTDNGNNALAYLQTVEQTLRSELAAAALYHQQNG